jgi:O-antigen/teichoic acid export membrane protein
MPSLLRSIFSIFSGKMAGIVIGLIFTPILVRVISQAQYGLYASVLAGFSIVTLIAKGGLFDATRKTVAEHTDQAEEVSSVISVSLLISLVYGTIATLLVFLSLQFNLIHSTYEMFVWILLGAILFTNIFTIIRGSFYGLRLESVGEILQIIRRLIYSASALLLAYVGYDVIGVFTGYTLSFVCLTLVGGITLFKYSSYGFPRRKDIATYGKEIVSFGGYQLIGGLSAMLLYRTDILLVEFFKESTSTALYQSAITPAEMIWFVPSAIQLAFLQHTASLWENRNVSEINENLKTGIKYAVLSLTLFGVGLFALADPFLTVYFGPNYVGAATTLQILIIGTFFFGITRVVVPVLQATGWVRYTELVTVGAVIINLLLNVILIPKFGIVGAGIGTGVSYIIIFIGNIIVWKYSQFDLLSPWWVGKLMIIQGIFAVLFLSITTISNFSPIVSLVILPPLGLLLFLGINITMGYIPIQPIKTNLRQVVEYLS